MEALQIQCYIIFQHDGCTRYAEKWTVTFHGYSRKEIIMAHMKPLFKSLHGLKLADFWTTHFQIHLNDIKVIMMVLYFWQNCRICCKELLLPLGRCPMRCMPNLLLTRKARCWQCDTFNYKPAKHVKCDISIPPAASSELTMLVVFP